MLITPTKYFDKLEIFHVCYSSHIQVICGIYVSNIHVDQTYRLFGQSSETLHSLFFILYAEYLGGTYIWYIYIEVVFLSYVHITYGDVL